MARTLRSSNTSSYIIFHHVPGFCSCSVHKFSFQELLQDKTNLEETLKSKNDEIMMLKSRLNQKSYSFSSDDLSSRLRALTITLVQKQSALERLTSDNNSLEAKYDQLQVNRIFHCFVSSIRNSVVFTCLVIYRGSTKKL